MSANETPRLTSVEHTPEEMYDAMMTVLRERIATSKYKNVKAFARELGVNYWTLRDNLNGSPQIRLGVVVDACQLLGVTLGELQEEATRVLSRNTSTPQ